MCSRQCFCEYPVPVVPFSLSQDVSAAAADWPTDFLIRVTQQCIAQQDWMCKSAAVDQLPLIIACMNCSAHVPRERRAVLHITGALVDVQSMHRSVSHLKA